jgi:hypothetical protein
LDARLAEFDRRLREIQAELLADEVEPAAASPVTETGAEQPAPEEPGLAPAEHIAPLTPAPASEPPSEPPFAPRSAAVTHGRTGPLADLLAQLRTAPDDYRSDLRDLRQLVSSVRELLGGIEAVLVRLQSGEVAPAREADEATIAAGPFTTIDAVRAFERDVASLPGVQDAAVRGYEGAARAIIDVRLGTEGRSRGDDL